jgi:hypothetical protein
LRPKLGDQQSPDHQREDHGEQAEPLSCLRWDIGHAALTDKTPDVEQ